MKRTWIAWVRIFVIVGLLSGIMLPAPRPAAAVEVTPEWLGPGESLSVETNSAILRARTAELNPAALEEARADLELGQVPPTLTFSLFPDVRLSAHFERIEYPLSGGYSLAGRIGADPFAEIHLARVGSALYASLNTPQGLFKISSLDGQTAKITQLDPARFRPEGEALPPAPAGVQAEARLAPSAGPSSVDDGSRIDVYVGYTTAAKNAAAAGGDDILALISTAIAETNTGYAESGINQRVVLVGADEYAYDESGLDFGTVLNYWTNPGDGIMDVAHTAREVNRADEMVLLIRNADFCGMAWLMNTNSPGFASNAFATVAWDCATGPIYYSFAHEMGHNMGATHNREAGTGAGLFSYSYGSWIWIPSTGRYDYRTVMAYNTNGYMDKNGATLNYDATRVNRWSSPTVLYSGQPTGAGLSAPLPAYNALTLNTTAASVAQFRDGDSPAAPDGLKLTGLTPTSVKLDWNDNGSDEFRFRVERAPVGAETWEEIGQAAANATTYTDSSLPASGNYRYRVLADNGNGRTASTEASLLAPVAPSGLVITGLTASSARLEWTDNSGDETHFRVQRAAPAGKWAEIGLVDPNILTYTDSSLPSNGDYRYQVLADNGSRTTASNESVLPAVPGALTPALVSPTQVNLTWTDQSALETGFRVARSVDSGAHWTILPDLAANTGAYSDTAAACGLPNLYRVWAYTGGAESASATANATPRPCAVTYTTNSSKSTIYFNWQTVPGATAYAVEFKNGAVFTAIPGAEALAPTITHWEWKGLPPQSSYIVRVVAVNAAGGTAAPERTVATMSYDTALPLVKR